MADQSVAFGSHNLQALIKDSPNSHIEISERLTAQLLIPPFRPPAERQGRTDLDLLLATSAITDFVGREEVWQDCLAWCDSPDTVSVRCITGQSGSGKTRLALELAHHLRARDAWDGRFVEYFLPEPFDLWAKTEGSNHVLLVFDQAGDVIGPLAASLRRMANDPPKGALRKLRVLLLARYADWEEGWLSTLQPRSTIEGSVPALFQPREPVVLGALEEVHRLAIYKQALQAAAKFTGTIEPAAPAPEIFAQARSRETLRDPLSLIMAAVTAVRSSIPDPFALTRLELAYAVAGTLAQGMKAAFTENPQLAHHMAAYVTISGGMSRDEAQDALDVEARSNRMGALTNPGDFVDRLRAWLPGEQTEIGAIRPDIVGEAFLLGTKKPRLLKPEATLLRALAVRRAPVLRALIRMSQDFCLAEENARKEPLLWLGAVIERGFADDFTLLRDIESALPASTVVLRKHAAVVTRLVVQRLSKMIVERSGDVSNLELVAESAAMLNNLGSRLSSLGMREEALASAEDSVTVYRELVELDRKAFLNGLATALGNRATARNEMGLLQEALSSAEESVGLCRELVADDRRTGLHNLAFFLTAMANHQGDLALAENALASATEAVSLCREAVQWDRETFLADLAHTLVTLAAAQSSMELRKESHASAEEAVRLRRELMQKNRDASAADLAFALVNLSTARSELGLHTEAVAAGQESLDLYRSLMDYSPGSFLPEMARALDNLSLIQGEAGQRQEALASAKEANRIYRQLVQLNRESFLPGLADSCINLAKAAGDLESEGAVDAAQEAVAVSDELAKKNRQAFLPQLALSLNNLAAVQTKEGLWDEVLDTQQTAISYYRELLQQSRSAYLPKLALCLVNQGGMYNALGMHAEALPAVREGVELFRELVGYSEVAFSPGLTSALINFGRALGEMRRIPEAVDAFEEAIALARGLAAKNKSRFLPELALALNNLAAMQSAMHRHQESFLSAGESVLLHNELIQLYGNVHAVEYARSLHTLGVALVSLGRRQEAFAIFAAGLSDLPARSQPTPQAKQVVQLLAGGYLTSSNQAGLAPDQTLVARATNFLQRDPNPQEM